MHWSHGRKEEKLVGGKEGSLLGFAPGPSMAFFPISTAQEKQKIARGFYCPCGIVSFPFMSPPFPSLSRMSSFLF